MLRWACQETPPIRPRWTREGSSSLRRSVGTIVELKLSLRTRLHQSTFSLLFHYYAQLSSLSYCAPDVNMTSQPDGAERSAQSLQNNPPRNTVSQSKPAQANIQDFQQPLLSSVEVQSNEKDSNANHESTAVNAASSKRSRKDLKDNPILFTVNWICIVLGVAAAIVFGIWAPLSYEATASGNREGSAVQSSMISALSAANDLASSALSVASAQGTALDEVQSRLGAMGQLALVGLCITETVGCALIFGFPPLDHISRKSLLVRSTEKAILIACLI
jgi:hypothetical protein